MVFGNNSKGKKMQTSGIEDLEASIGLLQKFSKNELARNLPPTIFESNKLSKVCQG